VFFELFHTFRVCFLNFSTRFECSFSCVEKCLEVFLKLTEKKVPDVIQEICTVIKDIFRKFNLRSFEGLIVSLCENMDNLNQPEAKVKINTTVSSFRRFSSPIRL
jgi:hypothetical protein